MSTRQKLKEESAYGYSNETDHLVEFNKSNPKNKKQCLCYGSVALLVLLVVVILVGVGTGIGLHFGLKTTTLSSRITISNLMNHLQDLEDIADSHPEKSRAVQYGFNDSAEMVIEKLKEAGFQNISRQSFTVATYEENTDGSALSASFISNDLEYIFEFVRGFQFTVMRYSNTTGGMEIAGNLTVVEEPCNADNYTEGTVALTDYIADETEAGCSLLNMTEAADKAGVIAVIMMRREDDTNSYTPPNARIYEQDGDDFRVAPLPVLGASYLLGEQLKDLLDLSDTGEVIVALSVDTIVTFWETYNVLAYTSDHQNTDSIIVFGSHLDSVPAGPGINDNGSGSAANLEIAIQIVKNAIDPFNQVLFAFWGAEELGLLGSKYFVNSMTEEQRSEIALNLNFDMIGSPNYVRQIYNGSGAENDKIVHASGKIQSLFQEFFESRDLNYSLKEFNGRSDYGPFIAEGIDIPAGGLATGADEVKSESERINYGGLANAILDPCYHQACDTTQNIHQEVYLQMSQAAAYVLEKLMMKEDLRSFLNSQ